MTGRKRPSAPINAERTAVAPTPARPPRRSEPATTTDRLPFLQSTAGNQAVVRWLDQAQAKLLVGPADDPYEREADQVAHRVLSAIRSGSSQASAEEEANTGPLGIQRRPVVGAAGGDLDADTESAIMSQVGRGRPLDGRIRDSMESAFGSSFDHVRVHDGGGAAQLSERVQAKAFTIGSDIFFGAGSRATDQELLAHELTHVIQQGGSRPLG